MNKFTVHYPNGIKRHINKKELDLLGASLQQVGPREYSAFSLQSDFEQATGPNFLAGRFTIEYPLRLGKRKVSERLETPKGLIDRLARPPKERVSNVRLNEEGMLQFA